MKAILKFILFGCGLLSLMAMSGDYDNDISTSTYFTTVIILAVVCAACFYGVKQLEDGDTEI